jgi:pimeloyl-ACP methyl ester carboxylesterase
VHGNPGTLDDWQPIAEDLTRLGEVAAFDLPGFGRSEALPGGVEGFSLPALAEATIGLIDELGWRGEPVDVIGHSHGGAISQTMAARHPSRVRSLVLLATLGHPTQRSYRLLNLPGMESMLRAAGRFLKSRHAHRLVRALLSLSMRSIFAPLAVPRARVESAMRLFAERPEVLVHMGYLAQGDPCRVLLDNASRIMAPVLFVHGEAERLVPVSCARSIYDCVVRNGRPVRFVTIPGAGHMLMESHPAELLREIASWFDALGDESVASTTTR